MKNFVVLILSLVLFATVLSAPAQDCDSANVLSATPQEDEIVLEILENENENVQAYFGNDFCDPKYTCMNHCSACGKNLYINLRTQKTWKKYGKRFQTVE